jgi:hypothetical protein
MGIYTVLVRLKELFSSLQAILDIIDLARADAPVMRSYLQGTSVGVSTLRL